MCVESAFPGSFSVECSSRVLFRSPSEACITGTTTVLWRWSARTLRRFSPSCKQSNFKCDHSHFNLNSLAGCPIYTKTQRIIGTRQFPVSCTMQWRYSWTRIKSCSTFTHRNTTDSCNWNLTKRKRRNTIRISKTKLISSLNKREKPIRLSLFGSEGKGFVTMTNQPTLDRILLLAGISQ